MAVASYAVVAKASMEINVGPNATVTTVAAGYILNVILWDGVGSWAPPDGTEAILVPDGSTAVIGGTYADDAFTAPAPPDDTPTPAQAAAAAYGAFLAAGMTVTSTGTSALNGTYPIDADSQTDISTEANFIATFQEFTTGQTTNLPWQLQSGGFVEFPTTASFLSFAKAAGQLVAAAKLATAQGNALPSGAVTIP